MVPVLIVSAAVIVSIPLYWKLYDKPAAVYFTIQALLIWGAFAYACLT